MRRPADGRTDRERIAGVALRVFKSEALFGFGAGLHRAWGVLPAAGDLHQVVAWSSSSSRRDQVPPDGSLVLCNTNPNHRWAVSFFEGFVPAEEPAEDGGPGYVDGWILREPGTTNLLHMVNEGFTVLVGLHPPDILEGRQRSFWDDLWTATHREGRYWLKPASIAFDSRFHGREAVVTFRRHIFRTKRSPSGESLDVPLVLKLTVPEKRRRKDLRELEDIIRAAETAHVWNPEAP